MADIKIDVEFIAEQTNIADNALKNMVHCVEQLKNSYSDTLAAMKSNEFINEFDESITELIEETNNISEDQVEGIINALDSMSDAFDQVDIASSKI